MDNQSVQQTASAGEERSLEELIGGGRTIAMVTTMVANVPSSRPVTCVELMAGRLSFLVSRDVEWVADIAAGRAIVHVTIGNESENTYLSLQGTGMIVADAMERERLWTPLAKIWFSGPEDPTLVVLRFDVTDGRFWDGPAGAIRQGIGLVRAMIEGDESLLGASGQVRTS